MARLSGWDEIMLFINIDYLKELEEFFEEVEKLWLKKFSQLESEGTSIIEEEDQIAFYDFHQDRFQMLRETFPRVTKYNLLVTAYSFLEKNSHNYYLKAKKIHKIEDSVRNDYCYEHIMWFRRNFGKNSFQKIDFEKFQEINQLRNRIAHSHGKVNRTVHKGIIRILEKTEEISLNSYEEIEISSEYIKDTLKVVSNLIHSMHYITHSEK